jgi:LmbE family N-acetylglucosaminyl deacetylase
MDWKRERDALIAQTYAFVQSVAGKIEETAREAARPEPRPPPVTPLQPPPEVRAAPSETTPIEPVKAVERPPPPTPLPRPIVHKEVQDEIRARIASFRAHQERFNRERAEYFSATLARLRAALEDLPPPRSGQITQAQGPLSRRSSPIPATNVSETLAGSRSSENGRGPS